MQRHEEKNVARDYMKYDGGSHERICAVRVQECEYCEEMCLYFVCDERSMLTL